MKPIILLIAFCSLTVAAENIFAQTAANYFYPLRVGNYWNYHTPGNQIIWDARTTRETIEGIDLIAGRPYYREKGVEVPDSPPSDTSVFHVFWLREDSLGNILIGAFANQSTNISSATLYNPPGIFFSNEYLHAGYTTEYFDSASHYDYQDSVLSTTETVTANAGTFTNCIEIRDQHKDTMGVVIYREYTFYAHSVGEVKVVRELPVQDVHTDDLIQYSALSSVREGKEGMVPSEFALQQNYPNPFNPSTSIRYALPNRSNVRIVLTNTLGQEVAVLTNGEQQAGSHEVQWRANVASGIYFYRIEAASTSDPQNRFMQVRKMLLLK